jgi:uncharacterized ferritin-like protein (DUF455 family)
MVLETADIWQKIKECEAACAQAFAGQAPDVPETPARDIQVFLPGALPPKKGLSFREGQARLLHDLASIELQAMELGLRTLREFRDAPREFREQLMAVTVSESEHLKLCLQGLERLGFAWGHWPVHVALWKSVDASDSLLDRILIVHRYLEGSGLDAGETFLRKLDSIAESVIHPIVRTILHEEIEHVDFGSRWYRKVCQQEKLDPATDFAPRMDKLRFRVPKRVERISRTLRLQAGFSESEIHYLENLRERGLKIV